MPYLVEAAPLIQTAYAGVVVKECVRNFKEEIPNENSIAGSKDGPPSRLQKRIPSARAASVSLSQALNVFVPPGSLDLSSKDLSEHCDAKYLAAASRVMASDAWHMFFSQRDRWWNGFDHSGFGTLRVQVQGVRKVIVERRPLPLLTTRLTGG